MNVPDVVASQKVIAPGLQCTKSQKEMMVRFLANVGLSSGDVAAPAHHQGNVVLSCSICTRMLACQTFCSVCLSAQMSSSINFPSAVTARASRVAAGSLLSGNQCSAPPRPYGRRKDKGKMLVNDLPASSIAFVTGAAAQLNAARKSAPVADVITHCGTASSI